MQAKECPRCHRLFARPPRYSNRTWEARIYCSHSCGGKFRRTMSDLRERFNGHVSVDSATGCWPWTGTLARTGYGQIKINGILWQAHRLSYYLYSNGIPKGLHVLHHCDNRTCVNPNHLYAGTPADNSRDAAERHRLPTGESHPHAKLTYAQVREIKASADTSTSLGLRYGVSRTAIYAIRKGKNRRTA